MNVLVLCTGNSCRSQIAEGYLKRYAPKETNVYSAGVETHGVNPRAIETMKADNVDISDQTSNLVDEYDEIDFDYIITVCDNAKERCPFINSNGILFHKDFPDPAKSTGTDEEIGLSFNQTRDLIKTYCKEFTSAYL